MTEVLPLSVTALLPALLFPLFGLMKSSQVHFPEPVALLLENNLMETWLQYFWTTNVDNYCKHKMSLTGHFSLGCICIFQRLPLVASWDHLSSNSHWEMGSSPENCPQIGDCAWSQPWHVRLLFYLDMWYVVMIYRRIRCKHSLLTVKCVSQVDAGVHGWLFFPLHVVEQHLNCGNGNANCGGSDPAGFECKWRSQQRPQGGVKWHLQPCSTAWR